MPSDNNVPNASASPKLQSKFFPSLIKPAFCLIIPAKRLWTWNSDGTAIDASAILRNNSISTPVDCGAENWLCDFNPAHCLANASDFFASDFLAVISVDFDSSNADSSIELACSEIVLISFSAMPSEAKRCWYNFYKHKYKTHNRNDEKNNN